MDSLPDDRQREALLDLRDARWCIYVEQLWMAHEFGGDSGRFAGENHFALARLQIDDNIRRERNLSSKNGRSALMELGSNETLMDRIAGTKPRN